MKWSEKLKWWFIENLATVIFYSFAIAFFTMVGILIHNDSKIDRTPKPTAFEIECLELGGLVLTNSKVSGKMMYSTQNCVNREMFIKMKEIQK